MQSADQSHKTDYFESNQIYFNFPGVCVKCHDFPGNKQLQDSPGLTEFQDFPRIPQQIQTLFFAKGN